MVQRDMSGATEMTREQMIAMKEGLEAQIRAMGQPEDPKACFAGKFTQAAGYKGDVEEEPRKLETGQMYEVVANFVAVRKLPSLEAPFVRRLKKGAKVEMFEWDKTRRWRRVCIEAPVDAEMKPRAPNMTEAQKRWATAEPVWDSARGKWVDAAPKVEVLDSDSDAEDAVVRRDAWIMVHHPEMGLLLQAVQPGDLRETQLSDPAPNEPKPVKRQQDQQLPGQAAVPATAAFAVEKARFDFYWGNTPNAAPPPLQSQPVVQSHGPQILPAARQDADFTPQVPAEPALIAAVRSGDEESVRALLQTGHDPNIVDALGETPLFEAASAANLRIVAALLLHGADSLHRSEHGAVAADVAEDPATRALLRRWDGQDSVPKSDLVQMLGKLTEADAKSVASRLKLEVSMEESQPETPAQIDTASPGVRYRVVYKKVAVRKEPNTKSQAWRQVPQGEIVEMFEWDDSHAWRRVRILAIREAEEGGGMQEVDGWMLIESPAIGVLLQEVSEGDDSDDDFAG